MSDRLKDVRVVVTSCDTYMGPPIVELFEAEGAQVTADSSPLFDPDEPADLIRRAGEVDVLVANLDLPAYGAKVRDI
jgi:2-keto-3-deoxy-L-fuconate dehydrogenase